jgi:hypothetical protein
MSGLEKNGSGKARGISAIQITYPLFLTGYRTIAKVISKSLNANLIRTDHQTGHMMAGIFSDSGETSFQQITL